MRPTLFPSCAALVLLSGFGVSIMAEPPPKDGDSSSSQGDEHATDAIREAPRFRQAVLYKPKEEELPESLRPFAPLFVREVSHDAAAGASRFSAYFRSDTVSIQGKDYDRVTIAWCKPGPCTCFLPCAVRIIVGSDGFPIVWEALPSDSDSPVLYISESFEKKAADRFGPPLSGRRFSAERAVSETPRVMVADVLPDGPVPMGPYIYLSAPPDHEIATLLCRCSPSRVEEFTATAYYESVVLGDRLQPAPRPVPSLLEFRADLAQLLRWPE